MLRGQAWLSVVEETCPRARQGWEGAEHPGRGLQSSWGSDPSLLGMGRNSWILEISLVHSNPEMGLKRRLLTWSKPAKSWSSGRHFTLEIAESQLTLQLVPMLVWVLLCPWGGHLHQGSSWTSHVPPGQARPPVYMSHHICVRWLHQAAHKQVVLERCPKRGCNKRRGGRVFLQVWEHEGSHVPRQPGHLEQLSRGLSVCCGPTSPPVHQGEWGAKFCKVHKMPWGTRGFTISGQTVLQWEGVTDAAHGGTRSLDLLLPLAAGRGCWAAGPACQCSRSYHKSVWHRCVGMMQRAFLLTYGFSAPRG